MTDFIAELRRSPSIYAQKLDLLQDRVLLIAMEDGAYRRASFLDDRLLTPSVHGAWAPYEQVDAVARGLEAPKPLHFIFHSGHVGSTLLSRMLDETGRVLGLREPLPLRTLADAHDLLGQPDSLLDRGQFDARLEGFLRLWSRGFAQTGAVVLKATSSAGRLAGPLLEARPDARAVYLNVRPETYLATLLAGANAVFDLKGFGPERIRRLWGFIGEPPPSLHGLSPGELAAISWLAERLTQQQTATCFGSRVLPIDFDSFLARLEAEMSAVLGHFAIEAPNGFLATIAGSPLLTRYSKAPEQYAYSPAMRAQLLEQARSDHAGEIRKGLVLLEGLGERFAAVASVL